MKQLREFERESGLEIYGLGLDRAKWESAMQIFAELIVWECITHIEKDRFQKVDQIETESDDGYDDGYVDGMGYAERILKEHFGVEE